MTVSSSLLRRDRGRSGTPRRVSALACAVGLTFVVACAANASALEPDPSAGSAPTSLQPDSFPAPTAAKPAAAAPSPRSSAPAPAGVGHSLADVPVTAPPASVPKVTAPAPATPIHVEPTATVPVVTPPPVTTPPVTTPPAKASPATASPLVETSPTRSRARPHRAQVTPKPRPVVVRLALPDRVGGTLPMPRLTRAAPTAVAAASRDLLPAALGVLALVATSGCLLAVAVRARRAELEG
jgi:hypothetical protein